MMQQKLYNLKKINISNYYSDDCFKKAVVVKMNDQYAIDFYSNDNYTYSLLFSSTNTLRYVEQYAENYVLGYEGD